MAKNNPRRLSDNELSYLRFGDLASPFFTMFLELKIKSQQKLTVNTINKVFQKTIALYNELDIIASRKKFIYQKNLTEATILKNDFTGFNFDTLSKEFTKTDPIQLYFINDRYLAFRFNHAYVDGSGALMLIDSFLECMSKNPKKSKTNSYISDLDYVQEIGYIEHKRRLSFKNKLRTKPTRGKNTIYYKRLTLDKKIPFLLSKIIIAINNYFENENLTYLLPTNIRKLRPEITSISNLTEILYLECHKNDDWLTISRKIHKEISEGGNLNIKNIDYGFIMDLPPSVYRSLVKISASISHNTGRFLTAGSITSLTHYFNKYDNSIFTINSAFTLPFYQPLLPYVLNIMETKDRTEIIFCSNDNFINENLANNILNDIGKLANNECLHNAQK